MSRHSTSSVTETTAKNMLWGSELNQEKQTCTFRGQGEKKDSCKLLLSTICLGEKAKEEVNRVEVLSQEGRKPPITIATLKASVLPMVTVSAKLIVETDTFGSRVRIKGAESEKYIIHMVLYMMCLCGSHREN